MPSVTMYTTQWCGSCVRLKRQLADAGIAFEEIDVDSTPAHDEAIMQASGGYRTVPTLKVGERYLVNPSIGDVRAALPG